jgi:hypothetical protein
MARHLLLLSLMLICTQLHATQRNVKQSLHPDSRLMAIVVATDQLAYLWILKSGDKEKLADGEEVHTAVAYAIGPASIPADYAAVEAPRIQQEDDLELEWSLDGQAVSLLYRQQPIAFVTASEKPGHSRAVTKAYDQADRKQAIRARIARGPAEHQGIGVECRGSRLTDASRHHPGGIPGRHGEFCPRCRERSHAASGVSHAG